MCEEVGTMKTSRLVASIASVLAMICAPAPGARPTRRHSHRHHRYRHVACQSVYQAAQRHERPQSRAGLIDKPFTANYADAREIVRLARDSGAPFFRSSSVRFLADVQAIRTG
jgi:hypothetical protein